MSAPYVDPSEIWEFIASIEMHAERQDSEDTTHVPLDMRKQIVREFLEHKYESAVVGLRKATSMMDGESSEYFIGQAMYWKNACSILKWLLYHVNHIK